MTIWMTALKLIPWDQVIARSPEMIAAARKLLNRTQESEEAAEAATAEPLLDPRAGDKERLALLEHVTVEQQQELQRLREQAIESAQLIQSLSDQNAQLVGAIEMLRKTSKLLMLSCGVALFGVFGLMLYIMR